MSTPIVLEQSADSDLPRPRAPWPVVTAFYLWWVLIVVQATQLAWMGLVFGQAAQVGGPAWDILFVYVPFGLPTLALVVIEVVFVLRLRRASRAARVLLAVLALPAAGCAMVILSNMWWAGQAAASSVSFVGPNVSGDPMFWVVVGALFLTAIAAAILPFLPPVGRYFRKTPRTAAPASGPEPPVPAPDAPPLSER
ncbi:hypothetical protein [Microbacterium sp. NPDC056569]|uniref:hypothetical protein n=1 Tax=Microbacterium sp. NPDC056569 TaxID=3345867 RepID=UPI003671FAEF